MLYFYYGQEDYNIEAELDKLKSKIVDKTFISTNYKVLNNPPPHLLAEVLRTPPLMFGKVLAVINCNNYFFGTGKDKVEFEDADLKMLEEALQDVSEALSVVFVCKIDRDSTKKIDTRKKLYKIISKYATPTEFAQYKSYQKEYAAYVQKIAKSKDLTISSDVISNLIETVGTNLRTMNNELEKLKLLIYPEKVVKKEDIKKVCTETEDIFLLADYILQGKKDLAMKEYRKLCNERHYLEIMATLQTSFARMLAMKIDSATLSPMQISTKIKMHEYVVKMQLAKMKDVSAERIVEIKRNFLTAETRIKTGDIGFGDLPVEMAILS